MPKRTVAEALVLVTKPIEVDEYQQWWNDAVEALVKAERMAEVRFAVYDPMAERVLRLISEVGRRPPEGE